MRFILWLILGYIAYRILKTFLANKAEATIKSPPDTEVFQDPVCGVYVLPEDATVGRLEGEKIYFCSMACLEKYQEKIAKSAV